MTTTAELRRTALAARRRMTAADRAAAAGIITGRFLRSADFLGSDCIGAFLSMPDEVATDAILLRAWRAKKRVFVPRTVAKRRLEFCELRPDTTLRRGPFGIWEPIGGTAIDPPMLDVVVTPLVAYDDYGNRIGMGAGLYDRTFAFLRQRRSWRRPRLIGVAFACQRLEKIPANPWDIPVFRVITES